MTDDKTDIEDTDLMFRIASGDRRAFESLLNKHLGRAVRTALRIVGGQADAEDVAQEAFTRVWLHAGSWKSPAQGGAKFTTWFHRIVTNLCIDFTRKKKGVALDAIAEPVDESSDAFGTVEQQQQAAVVAEAMQGLPERQRTAITLCFYEEHSNKDAADIMGVSVKALESLLVRGRRALKDKLLPREEELKRYGD